MGDRQIINRDVLVQIEGIQPGTALHVLDLFLKYAPGKYRACMEGLDSGDWTAVENAAHSLKSSAGHLGADRLLDACNSLETLAENGDAPRAKAMAEEFASIYSGTLAAFETERQAWTSKGR